ncbi:MAG: signal peptidase I [Syntrophaceae bacterium]|nr:signal peptidase I [Syntrophaceae bacterium]
MQKKKFVKEYLEPIVIAILIALFIRTFVVQAFKIPSGSMEPTLLVGDYLLVNKFIYGIRIPYIRTKLFQFKKPQRGDIIVFIYPKDPTKDFIKRVIGTEGEKVQIFRGQIYINDKFMDDPWGHFQTNQQLGYFPMMENYGPVVVPRDALFVLGDNRDNSQDSRFWGYVDLNAVLGKALIIYFSWNSNGQNLFEDVRWSRIGSLIH